MSPDPRIAILPRAAASEVITAAIARGGWAVALLLLVIDIPVLIDVFIERDLTSSLPAPIVVLVAMIALLVLSVARPGVVTRVLYIVGGTVATTAFAVLLLTIDPTFTGDETFLINRPAVALVLMTPTVMRPLDGLIWSSIGLALSLLATIAAGVILGTLYLPGWGPAASWAVYSVAYIVLSIVRVNQASTVPDLSRLEGDTRRMSIESQFEQRAAAIIHDTVLSDLTAVMNSGGPLDDRAREKFRADVATLKDPSWLREPGQAITVDHRDIALRNGTMALISEYQWRGLTVDLTGNNDSVVRLTDAATAAIHAALRACLDNVLAHSGTQSAEMVAGGNDVEITYMVIDHGVGFDPDAVPSTRLGLRHSVVGRIEEQGGSVRIWSRPGSGTSVLISVPQDAPDEIAGPAAPSEVDDAS